MGDEAFVAVDVGAFLSAAVAISYLVGSFVAVDVVAVLAVLRLFGFVRVTIVLGVIASSAFLLSPFHGS